MSWDKVGNILGPVGPQGPPGPPGSPVTADNLVFGEQPSDPINGSNTIYTVSQPFIVNTLEVYLNGLRQRRVDDYNEISSTQFQFVLPPKATDSISMDYAVPPASGKAVVGEIPSGAVNGSNRVFGTANMYAPDMLAVFQCGMRLRRTDDYVELTSTTFQLVSAPMAGDNLTIDYVKP